MDTPRIDLMSVARIISGIDGEYPLSDWNLVTNAKTFFALNVRLGIVVINSTIDNSTAQVYKYFYLPYTGVYFVRKFMDSIFLLLDYLGYAATVVALIMTVLAITAWFKGILPAIIRLGNGLAKRKIAIFAKSDTLTSLTSLLTDSGLILKENITSISKEDDIGRSEGSTLFLVYWPDWKEQILKINGIKRDGESLVIYAPRSKEMIPENIMAKLDKGRNVTVVNFRGRLLNDIVTAMITSGYTKK
jgi:hypothetical protein